MVLIYPISCLFITVSTVNPSSGGKKCCFGLLRLLLSIVTFYTRVHLRPSLTLTTDEPLSTVLHLHTFRTSLLLLIVILVFIQWSQLNVWITENTSLVKDKHLINMIVLYVVPVLNEKEHSSIVKPVPQNQLSAQLTVLKNIILKPIYNSV